MKFLGRRALNLADDLSELINAIAHDEASIAADGELGYITQDEFDKLDEAVDILMEYGRMRHSPVAAINTYDMEE